MHSLVEMFFDVDDFCQDVPITQESGHERWFAERATVEVAGSSPVPPLVRSSGMGIFGLMIARDDLIVMVGL